MFTKTAMLAAQLAALAASPILAETVATAGNTLTAPPAEWLGEAPHLVLMGTIAGHEIDIQIVDTAIATVAEFAGKREYAIDGEGYRYLDFEVALKAVIGDVERSFEFEFENHDFSAHALPATFEFVDAEFPEGLKSNLEAELEWETGGTSVNAEEAGWTGSLSLAADGGTADDKGLLPDGLVGGYAVAEKDGARLVMSFTVPVAEYEIED
jgi:hypothetical protein